MSVQISNKIRKKQLKLMVYQMLNEKVTPVSYEMHLLFQLFFLQIKKVDAPDIEFVPIKFASVFAYGDPPFLSKNYLVITHTFYHYLTIISSLKFNYFLAFFIYI